MDHVPASLPRRMMATFAAVEVLFKLLVGYGYLDLAAARTADERWTSAGWYAAVSLPFTAAFFVALWRMLAPVRRWAREQRAGSVGDATIRDAGEALHALSLRASRLWMIEWGGAIAVLIWLRPVTCAAAAILFLAAMVTGSISVARSVATWRAMPGKRLVSLVARERAIELRTPAMPLRRRLAVFGWWILSTLTIARHEYEYVADVITELGRGTTFTIRLPIVGKAAARAPAGTGGHATVATATAAAGRLA